LESIGERLRSVREAKKLTIREVAKDTNIAPRYIEALEGEEFDKFPGETYITGFLRSYSEYLKIDADEIIQSYKGHKIGESVTPLEELTRPTKPELIVGVQNLYENHRYVIVAASIVAVIVLAMVFYNIFRSTSVNLSTDDSIAAIKGQYENNSGGFENIHHLKLSNGKEIVQVRKNEAVQFIVDAKEVMFVVRDIKDNELGIEMHPQKKAETVSKDVPKMLSIPGVTRTVTLSLKGVAGESASIKIELGEGDDDAKTAQQSAAPQQKTGDQTKVTTQSTQNLKITFEAEFTAKTYVEIYLDGVEKTRGVVTPPRREVWEANSNIQMKIGNAGGIKAKINGKEYTFGLPGQVANKIISWKKDAVDPNKYEIVVRDWY
jgi:cytoskeletal protein RodZ